MHIKGMTRKQDIPARGAIEDWARYGDSWLYLFWFVILAVVLPEKF